MSPTVRPNLGAESLGLSIMTMTDSCAQQYLAAGKTTRSRSSPKGRSRNTLAPDDALIPVVSVVHGYD